MSLTTVKAKLVFLPVSILAVVFLVVYSLLYWLLYIQLAIIPLKENIVQIWIPIGLACTCVFLFIRPRVHILKLDKDNGRIRGLYYIVAAAIFCVPAIVAAAYLDTATGKLTHLNSIREISKKKQTKYYKPEAYVLFKDKIGIQPVSFYSGKRNQYLNWDIYLAIPFGADLQDTLQSPAAFLSVHYHRQISSNISDQERSEKWDTFWKESFEKFDTTMLRFAYLERLGNNEKREHLQAAAIKSDFYQPGKVPVILTAVNEPFEERNGNKLFYVFFAFVIGLVVWFVMIVIPGVHLHKAATVNAVYFSSAKKQLADAIKQIKPVKGYIATPVIVLINVSIFAFMVLKGFGFESFTGDQLVSLGAIYEPSIHQGQWWRLLTGMFLHAGFMHLLMNMVSLYITGMFLEPLVQTKKFCLGYLLSGIAAGLISLWWHDKPVVAVGSSGAVFGLYGILLAFIALKVFEATFNKVLLTLLGVTAGYSLLIGFLSEGIDNSAHLGGLGAGFILGVVFTKKLKDNFQTEDEIH